MKQEKLLNPNKIELNPREKLVRIATIDLEIILCSGFEEDTLDSMVRKAEKLSRKYQNKYKSKLDIG